MKKIAISALLLASACFLSNCNDKKPSEVKSLTKEITFSKEGELSILKKDTDSIIATLDIEIADDEYSTQTGLMYRHSMAGNQGMLFVFSDSQPRSFYMKNTEIPLDIIYINSDKKIESFQKNAKPFDDTSLPSEGATQYVLEVNAGLSDAWKLEKGDRIEFSKL
ncbi:DUF192 domain-containing protein [Vitellibacter sp. q18]|jgi:uncharacterized membrane protein (UPF0127 family)|nr:DUF192 domain-containing protein [Aequorivita lutea]